MNNHPMKRTVTVRKNVRFHRVFWVGFVLWCTTLVTSCNPESQKKQEPEFVGWWELQKTERKDTSVTNGEKWMPAEWMNGGKGNLLYSNDGMMNVHFMPADYAENRTGDYWYVGTYEQTDDPNALQHTRLIHSDPESIGEKVIRRFRIQNDTMYMFADEFNMRLTWIRADHKLQK